MDVSKTMGSLLVTAMLEEKDYDSNEKKIDGARKVGLFLTQALGISSKDLAPPLPQRFAAFGQAAKGAAKPEQVKTEKSEPARKRSKK